VGGFRANNREVKGILTEKDQTIKELKETIEVRE
jgi:hypothetical protein